MGTAVGIGQDIINRISLFLTGVLLLNLSVTSLCWAKDNYKFWGGFIGGMVYDDNIYKNSTAHQGFGYDLNLDLGIRSKFYSDTFCRLQYVLEVKGFDEYNLENKEYHFLDGSLKQRINEFFTWDLNGGIELYQFPNAGIYDSQVIYGRPRLVWYVFDRTIFSGGGIYEKNTYSDYDLDYEGTGAVVSLGQEISLFTFLECEVSTIIKNYPENHLYGIDGETDYTIRGGSLTINDLLQKETVENLDITLIQDFVNGCSIELIYQYEKIESNGNYFDWGSFQWNGQNTSGDERLIEDYYSYWSNRYGLETEIILSKKVYLKLDSFYMDKQYNGRLAKDERDVFCFPEQKRRDRQIFFLLNLTKEFLKNSIFGDIEIQVNYSYENNQSNDAFYDYSNNITSLFLVTWF